MIQIFWIFVIVAVAIALIGGFLKFLRVSASEKLIRIGTDVIVGIIISLDILIILAMFNITGIDMKGLLAFVFLMLTFIGFYRSSGPGVIYVITIFVMVFGYLFTGPYSGYIKTYTKGITAPLDAGIASAKMATHDLFLLITNPQEYIAEKQMKTVHSEESTSYPMGIEFTDISASPDSVFNGRRFYVQAYLENKGGLGANGLTVYAECGDKCYEDDGATIRDNEDKIEKYWKHVYTLGPFVSDLTDKEQFGTTADVTVHMSYIYSTESSLLVNVMDESEINRRLREGTLSFKLGIPVGKISPAMLVLSVGRQPIYSGDRIYLLISIVNKHPDSKVSLLPGTTKLMVKVPKDLFSVSSCDVDSEYVNYSIDTGNVNYTTIKFKFKRSVEISSPNKESSDIKPFYYFTCDLTAKNVKISREGEIYGYLTNFSVDSEKIVGPVVMRSSYLDSSPFSGVCVFNVDGAVEKEKCGCTGSGCKDDDTIPSDCKNNGGSFNSWGMKDSICLEGDSGILLGIHCCKRLAAKKGDYLGQCVKVNLKTFANNLSQEVKNIKYMWIRMDAESHAHCNDDVDIYGCYKSHCESNDWKIIKNNIDGSGPKIVRLSHDDLNKFGDISRLTSIDICTDPDKGSSCDHKIDWIRVLFNSTS
ncbi:MAG: hypothetical protein J7L43_01115 [Candidatus Aenigmarchaeota archaeon]|nr:hypothetical protein [Candidatus Aenigmarchaeota archaeon]